MDGTPTSSTVLLHDYLLVLRGAERTFAAMADEWPDAPIATLLYDEHGTEGRFAGRQIRTSALQRLHVAQENFRNLLPLYPTAAEHLPVAGHDVIISSSSSFAHGVRPDAGAVHVCYCHSPFRYAWHDRASALAEQPPLMRPIVAKVLAHIREWDLEASTRVTRYVANSASTRERIWALYGREAAIVHPPVEIERFAPGEPSDELLIVGEVVRHKRVEHALMAARRAGRRIGVVGAGGDLDRLRHEYAGIATFHGRVSDERLAELYAQAAALVVPNAEEFGITAVEAQAAGRPVIGVDAGGLRETVLPGITGVLVPPDDIEALAEAMADVDVDEFDAEDAVANARRFSVATFRERLREQVELATSAAGRRRERHRIAARG